MTGEALLNHRSPASAGRQIVLRHIAHSIACTRLQSGICGTLLAVLRTLFKLVAVFVLGVAMILAWNVSFTVRSPVRWLLFSRNYKSEVLRQPGSATLLKHIEWDGWGMIGQDTEVYLVFDPKDALKSAAESGKEGKFDGLPCEVAQVRRLEANWYSVQFYTDEGWDDPHCAGPSPRSLAVHPLTMKNDGTSHTQPRIHTPLVHRVSNR